MERRLVAILAADVVGYSRMIRADEEGTLSALRALREELIEPAIAKHRGRIVKLMGDGILAEFASVVDAVASAAEVQQTIGKQNEDQPEASRIVFRMGVNLGDVVIDGDDIHGDGVNVASRLETLSEPGGVCVSAAVHDQVRDRLDLGFEDMGEQQVKNIDRPVRVWKWTGGAPASAPTSRRGDTVSDLPDKPSIAVLPFDNMSGDPEQGYFADGIAEDIITDLSKVSGLFVIARNSSFTYKGRSPDIREVCRDLNVRYVLEGSVRKAGQRVRINAQLIDGPTGGHVWAERYDRDLEDIFALQDEVTHEIVAALRVALTAGEQSRRGRRGKVDPEAYDLLVRGRDCVYRFAPESMTEAQALLERAVAIEPDLAPAYAWLSLICSTEYVNGWNNAGPDTLTTALNLAQRARDLDDNEPQAHRALALASVWMRHLEEADRAAQRAIEIDPNFAGGFAALGTVRDFAGRHESAIEFLEQALRLDPQYHIARQFLGRAQFGLKRYADAEATFRKRLVDAPQSDMTRVFLASLLGHTGRHDEARVMWRDLMEINPAFSVDHLRKAYPYEDPEWFEHFESGLRKVGLVD